MVSGQQRNISVDSKHDSFLLSKIQHFASFEPLLSKDLLLRQSQQSLLPHVPSGRSGQCNRSQLSRNGCKGKSLYISCRKYINVSAILAVDFQQIQLILYWYSKYNSMISSTAILRYLIHDVVHHDM